MECAIRGMASMSLSAGTRLSVPVPAHARSARFSRPAALSVAASRTAASLSSASAFTASPLKTPLAPVPAQRSAAQSSPGQVVAKTGYKLKTHKASAKRFRVTGSGKVVRRNAWRAHLLRKKSTKRKNRLAGMTEVFRGDIDNIVGAMPYLKVKRVSRVARIAAPVVEEQSES